MKKKSRPKSVLCTFLCAQLCGKLAFRSFRHFRFDAVRAALRHGCRLRPGHGGFDDDRLPRAGPQAGAGPPLVNYLTAKGLDRTAALALVVDNVADLVHQVVEPFMAGCTINGVDHSAQPEHHATVRAIVTHMWREARRQ